MHSAIAVLSPVACPALHHFPTLSHKRYDFRGKKLLNIKFVFLVFSTTLVWHIFQSKKNWARCDGKCTYIGLNVHISVWMYIYRSSRAAPILLSDFNETWIFSTDFRKIRNQISLKSVQREPNYSVRTDGWTDMTEVIIAFLDFANGPKNSPFSPHSVFVFCVDLRTNSHYFPIQH